MAQYRSLDRVDASIDPRLFFKKYVSNRAPVIIQGLLKDPDFKADRWTDLDYLSAKAGHCDVLVEQMHPETRHFGTAQERIPISFREFIHSLRNDQGQHHYLTTQYGAEGDREDIDAFTHYPSPTHALRDDFPSMPTLTGNLVLQQVNLWVGRSANGSSSGLHHDFHDNLYCLLLGHKRFVLFPPDCAYQLSPCDIIQDIFPNGLIEYDNSYVVRADGLRESEAVRIHVRALEQRLASASGEEKAYLEKRHHDAMELIMNCLVHDTDEHDDFENLGLGIEADEVPDDADSEDEEEEEQVHNSADDYNPFIRRLRQSSQDLGFSGLNDEDNPSSFSEIPVAVLHQHFGLPTTAVPPAEGREYHLNYLDPFVIDLNPGEMLYLPASWWHEVTSSSPDSAKDHIHMAFNYWFYPPDELEEFEEPYEDELLWGYLRSRVKATDAATETSTSGKRSRMGSISDPPTSSKKPKQ